MTTTTVQLMTVEKDLSFKSTRPLPISNHKPIDLSLIIYTSLMTIHTSKNYSSRINKNIKSNHQNNNNNNNNNKINHLNNTSNMINHYNRNN